MSRRCHCNKFYFAVLIGSLTCQLTAADVIFVRSKQPGQPPAQRQGEIVDLAGQTLQFRGPSGAVENIPLSQITEWRTNWTAGKTQADALFAEGKFTEAAGSYVRAREEDQRTWARRQIIERIIECHLATGNTASAAEEFFILVASDPETLGTAGLPGEGIPGASGLTQGNGGGGTGKRGIGGDGSAETSVFGVKGRGSRFVYVFDRSASMSGYEGRPLAGAKRELLASLQSLDKIHQFQIIFYNDKPSVMNVTPGQAPQLLYGDDQGKRLAATFIGGVVADGGTRHMDALLTAIQMRPDVIFFLTDADEPRLTPADLRRLRERSRGTSINTIEFGSGPSAGRYTFLQQLADENNGKHAYVDVTALPLQ